MSDCPQTGTQSVLEHGLSVWEYTQKLISGDFQGFKLPQWFIDNHAFIVNNLHSIQEVRKYNIYHDCGKPNCIEYDDEGKRHFPNHAEVSKRTWLELYPEETVVANLIGYDMALHTETADEIKAHDWDVKTACTLLITSFAELHSNAAMFGGIESISFKMKYKKLDKRGKMLMKGHYKDFDKKYSYVIVRNDLTDSQKAVQGTHAAIEQFKNSGKAHPSIIYVLVKDEKKLKKVLAQLIERDINFSIFREPMEPYNHCLTAVCTEPISGLKREFMKKFQLM